jgi:hypothetical protein
MSTLVYHCRRALCNINQNCFKMGNGFKIFFTTAVPAGCGQWSMTMTLPSSNRLTITEETQNPDEGLVNMSLTLKHPETFTLKLRIRFWSTNTVNRVNGRLISEKAETGTYLAINIDTGCPFQDEPIHLSNKINI